MKWPMEKLGVVAPAKPIKKPKIADSNSVWLLNLDMVESHTGRVIEKLLCSPDEAGTSTHWFDENYVLYSKLRPYLNKVVVPDGLGLATTELVPMLPDPERLDRKYLAYYLRSEQFVRWVNEQVAGAKMPRVSMKIFWEHEIPLPTPEEQKRMVAILDKADAIRQKRQQAIALADDFLRSVFLDMFGDPINNPKGWERIKLGDLISSGPTNGLYKPSSAYGSGTRILRIDGFYDGVLSEQEYFKRVEISKEEVSRFSLIERGIVINRVNSPEYLGKCAFIDKLHESTVFESNMMFFTVDEELLNPVFLTQQLKMPNIKQQIKNCSKDAVNQSSINQQDVKSFEILLPNVESQNSFEAVVNEITRGRKRVSNGQSLIDTLFNSISHKVFSGQL
ncbi:restriction endonuclease [Aeromonas sp. 2MA4]|nr:restriction endonuclease [Aeromonas sp. 2MA4]